MLAILSYISSFLETVCMALEPREIGFFWLFIYFKMNFTVVAQAGPEPIATLLPQAEQC